LNGLIEKNKQIEKLREVIEDLEEKIKRKDYELKLVEDEKKKIDEKHRDLKIDMQRMEEKKNEGARMLEKEIDQLKRKEGQLKRFK
jgi:predicted  nucleic acid-binding Zn-ribbon protein